MLFIQPVIHPVSAQHAGAQATAEIATLNTQARAHARVPFTFGQLAQTDSTTARPGGAGTGFNSPGAGTLPAPVTTPITPGPTNENTPSSGTLPGTGSGMDQDTSLGKSASPTSTPSPLPPIDTTPMGTGASGTGGGEDDKSLPGSGGPGASGVPERRPERGRAHQRRPPRRGADGCTDRGANRSWIGHHRIARRGPERGRTHQRRPPRRNAATGTC